MKERAVFHFGEFSLDAVAKVLFKQGEPVHLTRKAVETLLVLVENPGQVLTKEEIMAAVWTDRVVDEANLAQNIAVIRRTLNAERGTPAYIETFPGRGYRIQGPVTSESLRLLPPEPEVIPPPIPSPPEPAPLVEAAAPSRRRTLPLALIGVGAGVLIVAAASWSLLNLGRTYPESAFRVTALTRMTGKEYQPAVSPDGSKVAFLWAQDGATPPAVWIKPTDEQPPRALTTIPTHYSSPCWSAGGSKLAFLRIGERGAEIVAVALESNTEQVVARLSAPTYGLDDRLLAWSWDARFFAVSRAEGPGRAPGLALVSPDGSQRTLTTPPPATLGDVDPRFSPDGRFVTFIRLLNRSQQELFSVAVEGGQPVQLTDFGKRISGHDWLPSGNEIGLSSDRAGEFRLWRLPMADGVPRTPRPVGVYSEFPIQLSFARTSPKLVYSALHQDRNIWRFDLKDKLWTRLIASTGQDASPQYSPGDDRISFRSDRTGEEHLWVVNSDGSGATQITRGEVRPSVGKWGPDGHSVVFNDPRTDQMYIVRFDGSSWNMRKLGVSGVHPVFSPNGRWIYAGGLAGIIRLPVHGGQDSRLMNTKAESIVASPDGKYLYFARERNDTSVWRMPAEGGAMTAVAEGLVPGCTSCWAVSAEGIYYLATDKQSFDRQMLLYRDFRTNVARTVTPYPEPLWPQGSGPFSLSSDGRYLLTVRVDPSNSDVMLVHPIE